MVVTKKAIESDYEIEKVSKLLIELGIDFKNISIYILAFIHRSIVNERNDYTPEHNERLEFLGDAVLELVITDELFRDFPDKPEGDLTDIRSAIVRGKNLACVAKELNFQNYLFLGKGEEKTGGRDNDYILANTLEAFIGALYVDLGYIPAKEFILKHIYVTLEDIFEKKLTKDFKTLFQEFAQAKYDITPSYQVLKEEGPDHNKNFEVGIFLDEKQVGTGLGSSKKKAQEAAAKDAYEKMFS
ncbi:MAG: ribonuclease III [Candidatus Gracilibacteria bacterium]|nr:ribonuclease III [Candidatus Gracilibacteria bacterium]